MFALIWTVLVVAAVWFLLLRPQRKRIHEHQLLMTGLEVGHEIVTAGGIYGRIEAIEDDVLRLEVAPGVTLRIAKRAVARDLSREQAEIEARPETGDET